jgi:SagB-type dehydrogenase family enzyme
MKFRSAQTLVYSRDGGALLGCNFLTRRVFECSVDVIAFLGELDDWQDIDEIAGRMPDMTPEEIRTVIDHLVAASAIVEQGSALAHTEQEYQSGWRWGVPAAMMHFCLQDPDHMTLAESEALQRRKVVDRRHPALYRRNDGMGVVQALPDAREGNELIQLMARRRTVRSAGKPTITLRQLSDCLFAGLGITGTTQNAAVGALPLSMTPSGGARNPYEAYVYARDVEGLAPGVYHYSAHDHDLGLVKTNRMPKFSELVGGQDWADDMPCMIILCAMLERTMWKYDDPNAYRVVLIEAGHIGQNIMLAATRNGLSACPTAALNHSTIRDCVSLKRLTDTPVYALTLAVPGAETGASMH